MNKTKSGPKRDSKQAPTPSKGSVISLAGKCSEICNDILRGFAQTHELSKTPPEKQDALRQELIDALRTALQVELKKAQPEVVVLMCADLFKTRMLQRVRELHEAKLRHEADEAIMEAMGPVLSHIVSMFHESEDRDGKPENDGAPER